MGSLNSGPNGAASVCRLLERTEMPVLNLARNCSDDSRPLPEPNYCHSSGLSGGQVSLAPRAECTPAKCPAYSGAHDL